MSIPIDNLTNLRSVIDQLEGCIRERDALLHALLQTRGELSLAEERLAKGQQLRLTTQESPEGGKGGLLNPEWVEWLMGWPIGWTALQPLAMDKFREWQQQHGGCSSDDCNADTSKPNESPDNA